MLRRALIVVAAVLLSGAATAVELGGVIVPDSARLTADGPTLMLNGAGERRILFFRIYAMGLYLPAPARTLPEVLAQKGPKRLQMVVQYSEITAKQVHKQVIDRIEEGTQPAEMAVMRERLGDLARIIDAEGVIRRGGTIMLDYLPGKGTVIRVNGVAHGSPIPGEDFYNALLGIWLGEKAKSPGLREALLGRD